MLKSKLFWITTVIVAVIVFVIGINQNKLFVGETDILVLSKSDQVSRNFEQVVGDVKEIPGSLSFYNKLLQENSDITDVAAGLPDAQRKAQWNADLEVKSVRNSGVLRVQVSSPSQLQAEILSEQTAKDITVVMSRYYNIQSDLDIRLIDGPIVQKANGMKNNGLIALSIIIGLFCGFILKYLSYLLFGQKTKLEISSFKPSLKFPSFAKKEAVKTSTAPIMESVQTEEIFAVPSVKKEAPIATERKTAAPANLPVGEEFVMSSLRRAEKKAEPEKMHVEPLTHEASEDEVRARLNKLLNGKL